MLAGAMDELQLGDPWATETDIGPVIDAAARQDIAGYVARARAEGRVIKELSAPPAGQFVAPTVLRVRGIAEIPREVFGPVLHVATFPAGGIDAVIDAVNATGYGLTFGLHSRIDDRVQRIVDRVRVGNTYVNRNQIGAVVGSQPFGGEGLSGTGPKAGGPLYLGRFTRRAAPAPGAEDSATTEAAAQAAIDKGPPNPPRAEVIDLPGPTGESNRLTLEPRGTILCLGPSAPTALAQALAVRAEGGVAVEAPGLPPAALTRLTGIAGAIHWGTADERRPHALALAARPGPILPLIADLPDRGHAQMERHVCIDTTASGGNAQLLAQVARG
jgi:RHH-type proline utilization regulon transcriptional repressor/proline dehydrogenase/delta 1-pyrroline-5-carboxylate dehydrogenase